MAELDRVSMGLATTSATDLATTPAWLQGTRGEFRVSRRRLMDMDARQVNAINRALAQHLRGHPGIELRMWEDHSTDETVFQWGPEGTP